MKLVGSIATQDQFRGVPAGTKVWIAISSYAEKDMVKAAGFRWNPDMRSWWTSDRAVASRMVEYADGAVKAGLMQAVESLEQSRKAVGTKSFPRPEGLEYLPFQSAGIEYAVDRRATLIADEMGLGKTIQAIGVINATAPKSVLVVCPASLKGNWERELRKWLTVSMSIGIADGADLPSTDIVIANYDILGRCGLVEDRVREGYRGKDEKYCVATRKWDMVIVDEAHYCKNYKAIRTRAVAGLCESAGRLLLLTGTPVVNRPTELWQLLTMLDPQSYGRQQWWWYHKRYCNMEKTRYGVDVSGANTDTLPELQDRLRRTMMIRRLKQDVLTELPPKRRQLIVLDTDEYPDLRRAVQSERSDAEMSEARIADAEAAAEVAKCGEESEYATAVKELSRASAVAFADMSRVRKDTAVAKAPYVVEHVKEMLENVDKVVVFAHHHEVVDILMKGLAQYNPVSITGETAVAKRQQIVEYFQTNNTVRVFVGSITAAGVGITLTAASTVVFSELDWVPGNMSQAEDRCHRIGQTDSVNVYHIVVDGSIDQRLAQTIVDKQAVIEAATDKLMSNVVSKAEPKERPATRSLSRDQIDALAAKVTAVQAAALHDGLRCIAGMDTDYARSRNDVGFSKIDVRIGHDLAARDYLTPKQAVLAARLCRKYRRQLGSHESVETAHAIIGGTNG